MLKLKEIYVGDTDAKNELLTMEDAEIERFMQSFTLPAALDVEEYLLGRNFFVTGLKGTGKTAFLRYLALRAKAQGYHSKFVLFKSEIKEGDRVNLKKTCDTIVVEEGGSIKYLDDYEKVWLIFLHKVIIRLIDDSGINPFVSDDAWCKYRLLVAGADYSNKALGIFEFFPKIAKGVIDFKILDQAAKIEIDFVNAEKSKVKLTTLTNSINYYFEKLSPNSKKLYFFVDELELNLGSQAQYKRDSELIRDLIIAVEQINRAMAPKKFPLKICCAIRKEVIRAIEGTGKEIAKPIEDFGVEIVWSYPVRDQESAINHSLITLLAKKIYISEVLRGISSELDVPKIIEKYFPRAINSVYIAKYLLLRTWFRPRDLSRMLKIIIQQYGDSATGFQQVHFEQTQKNYATSSWTELAEELSAKYTKGQIRGIEMAFTNITRYFNYQKLENVIASAARSNAEMKEFVEETKLSALLNDLFSIGFIGNSLPTRFHFRGDTFIQLEKNMQVHRALWPHFSIIDG